MAVRITMSDGFEWWLSAEEAARELAAPEQARGSDAGVADAVTPAQPPQA